MLCFETSCSVHTCSPFPRRRSTLGGVDFIHVLLCYGNAIKSQRTPPPGMRLVYFSPAAHEASPISKRLPRPDRTSRSQHDACASIHRFAMTLRPHVKTSKSRDVVRRALDARPRITVSTLKEADHFLTQHHRHLYSVGIAPNKLDTSRSRRKGADVTLLLYSVEALTCLRQKGQSACVPCVYRNRQRRPSRASCPGTQAREICPRLHAFAGSALRGETTRETRITRLRSTHTRNAMRARAWSVARELRGGGAGVW